MICCLIVSFLLIVYFMCVHTYKGTLINRLYGYVNIQDIASNKELLLLELNFVNKSIEGLSKLALTAASSIMATIFTYKDRFYNLVFSDKEMNIFSFSLIFFMIIGIYLIIYFVEVSIKSAHKQKIIHSLNDNQVS